MYLHASYSSGLGVCADRVKQSVNFAPCADVWTNYKKASLYKLHVAYKAMRDWDYYLRDQGGFA